MRRDPHSHTQKPHHPARVLLAVASIKEVLDRSQTRPYEHRADGFELGERHLLRPEARPLLIHRHPRTLVRGL
jgi:hypothetical protein